MSADGLRPRLTEAIRGVRDDHLVKTASALILNTLATSGLGVIYWIIVAHRYSPVDLARNAAAVSVMLTLSGVAQLNMGLQLGTLLPRAGHLARRLLAEVYVTVSAFTILVAAIFFLVLLPLDSSLRQTISTPVLGMVLVAGVLLYNIFALQDAALAALRSPGLVPLENMLYGLLKIGLVIGLAASLPHVGIFLSWAAPLVVLVVPISALLFKVIAPRQITKPVGHVRLWQAARPAAWDYIGYLFLACSTLALPALAVALLGASSGAVFSVAYLTSSSLDLIAGNLGVALTVEASHRAEEAMWLRRMVLTRGLPLVGIGALLAEILAPFLLLLYGAHYEAAGTGLLRLLIAGALPRAIAVIAMAQARAEGRTLFILRTQALSGVLVVGGAIVLTGQMGLLGMGVAWVGAQTIVALSVLPSLLERRVRLRPA